MKDVRNIQDAAHTITTAMPAAGASVNTAPLNLEQPTAAVITESLDVVVTAPVALAGKSTATLSDSADGEAFAPIPELAAAPLVATRDALAAQARFKLPPTARQYIRAAFAVGAGAGNFTTQTFDFQFRF